MSDNHEEKRVPDPIIDGGVYTPIDPLTGSVGAETGDLAPEAETTAPRANGRSGEGSPTHQGEGSPAHHGQTVDPQENTPGHHAADRALEYDDPADVDAARR